MSEVYWVEFIRKSDGKPAKSRMIFCNKKDAINHCKIILLEGRPARIMRGNTIAAQTFDEQLVATSEVYRSDGWIAYEIEKMEEISERVDLSPEDRKKALLDKVAKLMEEYENPTGENCSNDSMAEIWFEDGKERYLFNGERFTKINPHWKDFERFGENIVCFGNDMIKATEEKNIVELDGCIKSLHYLIEEIQQIKENGYLMDEDICGSPW